MNLIGNLYWYPEAGMMDCNTYLFNEKKSVLVDPGATRFIPDLLSGLKKDGIDLSSIDYVIDTHLHPDHSGANRAFMNETGAKLIAYKGVEKHFSSRRPLLYIDEEFKLNGTTLKILHTPGHARESISIYWPDEKLLICGDLIFAYGVGRTDFSGGDFDVLKDSIERMSKIDLEYILPGHGEVLYGKVNVKKNFEYIKKAYLSGFF